MCGQGKGGQVIDCITTMGSTIRPCGGLYLTPHVLQWYLPLARGEDVVKRALWALAVMDQGYCAPTAMKR